MNYSLDQLVKIVLNKDSIKDCSTEELQQLTDQHPFFTLTHLLLLKKLKEGNAVQYKDELQNKSLFFQNPLWLDHLLNDVSIPETNSPQNIEAGESEINETKEDIPVETIHSIKIEPLANDAVLTFEPFHTVDYFASQGIRFRADEKPNDKFGQQLKSFTEWLKTLKKLPQSETSQPVESSSEQKVEQLAEHSIEDRNVVTEAMAEVWEKQGNSTKAMEIYTKLSLLDPAKSSYFAAKIEQLKKTS